MIVSHKHRFIFIKPIKVAGTSIELLLTKYCGNNDVITPFIYEPNKNIRDEFSAKEPQNYQQYTSLLKYSIFDFVKLAIKFEPKMQQVFSEHLSAEQIKRIVGEKVWNSYYKFSIVRNPWDHLVSWYEWRKFRILDGKENDAEIFRESVLTNKYHILSQMELLSVNGQLELDFVIKYENLNDDFNFLLNSLSLGKVESIPHTKSGIRTEKNYRKYYDDFTRELVHRKNSKLIELFGYEF